MIYPWLTQGGRRAERNGLEAGKRRMWAPLLLGFGLIVIPAALLLGLQHTGPHVRVENNAFDFGDADVDADIECKFRITNTGRQALKLTDVKTDCACSAVRLDKSKLLKGETATLSVTLRTSDRGGTVQGTLVVKTNDPRAPIIPLRIVGRVRPTLQIVPSCIYFCLLDKPELQVPRERFATLYVWSDAPVSVEKVACSASWLSSSFVPNPDGRRQIGRVKVDLTQLPSRDDGRAEVNITARSGAQVIERKLLVLADVP